MLFLERNVLNVGLAVFLVMTSIQTYALNVMLVFSYLIKNAKTASLTALIVKTARIVISAN